MSLIFDRLIRC